MSGKTEDDAADGSGDSPPSINNIRTEITKVGNSFFIKATHIVKLMDLHSGDEIVISVRKLPKDGNKRPE